MTIEQCIRKVDALRPNAYTDEEKTDMLNDIERRITYDVFSESDFESHVWSDRWEGTGVKIPDKKTVVVPGRLEAREGGTLCMTGLVTYDEDNVEGLTVVSAVVGSSETTITLEDNALSESGTAADTGTACVRYAGGNEEFYAPDGFSDLYVQGLHAAICWASGEYDDYANEAEKYNEKWNSFRAWYCRNYVDSQEED